MSKTPHEIETRIGRLYVETSGEGPPMILWHSFFVDGRTWSAVEPSLARHRSLINIDGAAHGRSGPAPRLFSLEDCAAAALEVLDALGIDGPIDWLGNAWGGHTGIVFAAEYPDRCRSLVTISAPLLAMRGLARAQVYLLMGLYRFMGPVDFLTQVISSALLSQKTRSERPDLVTLVRESFAVAAPRAMVLAARSVVLGRPDIDGKLATISAPVLLMTGSEDEFWTPQDVRNYAKTAANATFSVIDGVAHIPQLEAPAQVISELESFWGRM